MLINSFWLFANQVNEKSLIKKSRPKALDLLLLHFLSPYSNALELAHLILLKKIISSSLVQLGASFFYYTSHPIGSFKNMGLFLTPRSLRFLFSMNSFTIIFQSKFFLSCCSSNLDIVSFQLRSACKSHKDHLDLLQMVVFHIPFNRE